MAIDVRKIQEWVQRVIEFSVAYVKEHPIVTFILSFVLLLYIFLRPLFIFLFFAIPIFLFIGVAFRLIFHIHQENLRNAKGEISHTRKLTQIKGGRNLDKRGYSYAHAQSVRRRGSKKYENRVHFQDKKDMVFSIDNNDLVDKAALFEETPKEIREVEVESTTVGSNPDFGDGSELRPNKYNGERLGLEGESSDEREDEDEEEAPEDGNKAVEWTEYDQKNLMDLGFSEVERNKRLESLIAKRKARKLLSLQVRRTLMNIGRGEPSGENSSFLIPKMVRNKSAEALISPTPGSAPSVLLPVHNPFDIPYDPQEEKPNLTGGFQEELNEDKYNENAVFCRHESFSLGLISQGSWELDDQSRAESSHRPDFVMWTKSREIPEFSRFKMQSGKEDLSEPIETETSQENENIPCANTSSDPTPHSEASEEAIDLNNVHSGDGTKKFENNFKLDTDEIHESISSSSSEINAPFSTANKDEILKSLSFSVRKNTPVLELDTNIHRDEFYYHENPSPYDYKGMYRHTPSQSIASDLQVEISEVCSQITNISSDGGSPKFDVDGDVDLENEGISGNKGVWVASPQLNKVEENEAKSGEVREVSEQDIMKVGFSRITQDNEEPIPLESNLESPKALSNSGKDHVELVHDDEGIMEFIQHTYGEDPILKSRGNSQDMSDPTLNNEKNIADISEGNNIQTENNNSNSVESLGETQSEPEQVAEGLNVMGNINTQVSDVLVENGPREEVKDPSILVEKPAEILAPINCVNDPKINISSKEGQNEQVVTTPVRNRAIKRLMLRRIKPGEHTDVGSSPVSTPNSVKKFYLMANMSYDEIEFQQFDVELERKNNCSDDSTADETHAADSVSLKESSFPLNNSSGDGAINEGSVGVLEQKSDNGADLGSKISTEENKKNEIKRVEIIGELEMLEDVESHPKSFQTGDNGVDIGSQIPMEKNEKTEKMEGVENIGELETTKDVESHPKLDNIINNSETVEVVESYSGLLPTSETNNDQNVIITSTLNKNTKPEETTEYNITQPESNNLISDEFLEGGVAEGVAERLDVTKDDNIKVKEMVAENNPSEASLSTSPRTATDDKDQSTLLKRPTKLGSINVVNDPEIMSSPFSTPNSASRKFYLMANMSFDDVHVLSEESNMEVERNGNLPKDSTAEQTIAGDSVGLQESNVNDRAINEFSGGELVETSDNNVDAISSQIPTEKDEKNETIKEVDDIGKLKKSEDVEGHS